MKTPVNVLFCCALAFAASCGPIQTAEPSHEAPDDSDLGVETAAMNAAGSDMEDGFSVEPAAPNAEIDAPLLPPESASPSSTEPESAATASAEAAATASYPRCSELDLCSEGQTIDCPPDTFAAGAPAYICQFMPTHDPFTGRTCVAWTWYDLGGCGGEDPYDVLHLPRNLTFELYKSASGQVLIRSLGARGVWGASTNLGGKIIGRPRLAQLADGRLLAIVRGTTNAIYIKIRSTSGAWPSTWTSLSGVVTNSPSWILHPDGRMEIFVRGTSGAYYRKRMLTANGAFEPTWQPMGGLLDNSPPTPVMTRYGRVWFIAKNPAGYVFHNRQVVTNGGYAGWQSVGTSPGSRPVRGLNLGLGVIGIRQNESVQGDTFMTYQTAPNSTVFSPWQFCVAPP